MTTKITYADALNTVLTTYDLPAEIAEKLTALKEQIEKRNSAERKPTKVQQANVALREKVLAVLTTEPVTVSDLMTRDPELAALSNQKVAALVNALVKDGQALKLPDGRKMTFCLPR